MSRSSIMMSFKRLLNKPINFSLVIFAVALLISCGEKPRRTGYIARVNDSFLTNEELNSLIDTNSANYFQRNEVIRNWINREILYQEAVKSGLLEENKFLSLVEQNKKEIAGSLLLEKQNSAKNVNVEQIDILNYYRDHKKEFKLTQNSFLLNIIHFSDENRAVEFRKLLLDSDWKKALNIFYNDSTIISSNSNQFLPEQDIYSEKILRIVKRLHPLEISIVIAERERYYSVVQLLNKYTQGSIPELEIIKPVIEKRYIAGKRKELIENYIKKLYSNYEIEVKN